MKKLSVLAVAASLVLAVWLGTSIVTPPAKGADAPAPAAQAEVGKPAPDFTLKDSNGKKRSLKDHKGKIIVLEWVNYGCPFVRKHYDSGNMQSLQKKFTKEGVIWLSICSSAAGKQGNFKPKEINKKIAEQKAAPTAYLIDEDGKVGHMYGAKATPHMFVVDKTGTLVYAGAIDDKPTPDQADIPSAKNFVAAAIEAQKLGIPVANAATKAYGCSVKY